MSGSLNITAATVDPALLDLPWNLPLDEWSNEHIAILPKGISRHLVRFANLSGYVIAIKETTAELAKREYEMLRNLAAARHPLCRPGRRHQQPHGCEGDLAQRGARHPAPQVLTPLPRAVLADPASRHRDPAGRRPRRAAGAPAHRRVLLGDVSLSNTLFRRDAGAFAAYLVDAETGQLYDGGLSNGQRENDLEIARVNIAGELMDLEAGGRLDEELDPIEVSNGIVAAYRSLWKELTGSESFATSERWRISKRVDRLNELGFDIEELAIKTDDDGHDGAHPAEGRGCRPPPAPAAAAHRPRRPGEPGPPPAQRSRLVPRRWARRVSTRRRWRTSG